MTTLELPEVATWGIAVHISYNDNDHAYSRHELDDAWEVRGGVLRNSRGYICDISEVLDFIPLTADQVDRIEGGRR